jgi:hypothetical protein
MARRGGLRKRKEDRVREREKERERSSWGCDLGRKNTRRKRRRK